MKIFYLVACCFLLGIGISCGPILQSSVAIPAPKPLYVDPIFDGAADPVIIYNSRRKTWFMFYTSRRANMTDTTGVKWVHGTRIGIAESKDGTNWKYFDTANINYRPVAVYTHWAPDVIAAKGIYHMYLTYVPGVFVNWNHPRDIIHLTSKDLLNWKYEATLKLASDRVIDASVFQLPGGTWRMWYNNERDGKSIYHADSKDLYNWTEKGKTFGDRGGEGPKVFYWKNKYWMIVDNWTGMGVYASDDLTQWKRQPNRILEAPGVGKDDQAIGGHCDVVVQNDHAYIFYFTHPGRVAKGTTAKATDDTRRSVIQLGELELKDGMVTCNRDQQIFIKLKT